MIVMVRGGGDLASGVALRLYRAGFQLVITEIPQPLAVRRLVAFSEAIRQGRVLVEEVTAVKAASLSEIRRALADRQIPVVVDPAADFRHPLKPAVLVDARMTKAPPDLGMDTAPLVIGLGPGFVAGVNCHAVIETKRGHTLGRVIWQGEAASDTRTPEPVGAAGTDRVLRAPTSGILRVQAAIGDRVAGRQQVAMVDGQAITAAFDGVVRGLLPDGFPVKIGMKIGDIDPRADPEACRLVSDKALAVGGGVLEAVLSRSDLRLQRVVG